MVTVRLDSNTRKEIARFSKDRLEPRSKIIRRAVVEFVQKESGLNELKQIVAKKFAEGKLSFDELVRVLGFEEAKKVAYFVDIAEKSLQEGI